jgi:hypothetical protein
MGLKLVRIGEDKPSPLLWTSLTSRWSKELESMGQAEHSQTEMVRQEDTRGKQQACQCCHAERSEASRRPSGETLRCAQGDTHRKQQA